MTQYDFKKIEENWKNKWFDDNIYEAVDFSTKPKKYILAELPYPSGKFLHIGHMMRYTVPEIYSRYLRMRGFNVLFPMGWDCFGLPAETFAIKEGITPQEAIAKATVDYKKAMQNMGYAIDWSREINTSDPSYYKWTQWTFTKLWEAGLAVQKEMPVWWCKELGVLADEEVLTADDGVSKVSERGSYPVLRKQFKQWVLKLPEFAERLLEGLNRVDYTDSVKQAQINWIGKKDGAKVDFMCEEENIEAFTTRPDTLFGVTFLALSPDHKALNTLIGKSENIDEVLAYIEKAKNLSDMERQTKEKTGVLLKGIYAHHPFKEITKKIPVFVADYIISNYGTGAVMGVPAHDDRDHDFAKKYNLEILKVIESSGEIYTGTGTMINSDGYNGLNSEVFKQQAIERLIKEKKGSKAVTYKFRDQVFSRQRYWGEPIPLIYKEDGTIEADKNLPLELPVMKDFLPDEFGISPLSKNTEWNNTKDSKGKPAQRETDTMPTWAGSNWYFLRYIDPKNGKAPADFAKLKYWLPVDKYFGDAGHTTVHLLYSRFWHKFLFDLGVVPVDEPYMYRMSGGMLLGPDGKKMSKSRGNVIDPKDVVDTYGADAARVYLAFIGPYEDTYPWNESGIRACWRLLKTIYELKDRVADNAEDENSLNKKANKMVKNITGMFEDMKMNTGVSEIMIFVNEAKKVKKINTGVWKKLLKVLAPLAPFTAEELWQELNHYEAWDKKNSVHLQDWPVHDEKLLLEDEIQLPVQINGKIKLQLSVNPGASEESVKQKLLQNPKFKELTEGSIIGKIIYVNGKIISVVLKEDLA